jgi:ESCRT-II complex subunit
METGIWRLIEIAEMQRSKEDSQEKEKLAKMEKLKKLKELQAKLKSAESAEKQEPADELESLESSISSGIAGATKGEMLLQVSTADDEIEKELAALETEIKTEEVVIVKTTYEQLLEIHDWLAKPQYGFMFTMPNKKKDKDDFDSWKQEWSQVLLDYAKVGTFHIIFPKRLLTETPFNKFHQRKKSIEVLSEALIEKDLAKWVGKKKREQLRVYWKSLEEWGSVIEIWARDNAVFDLIMVHDIRSSETEFAELPEEDLKTVFEMIQKNDKGEMVEIEDGFGIKFKL